jgi:hypothetical protein
VGEFKNYSEKGELLFTANYLNGKATEKTFYHANGKKAAWISYSANSSEQKGWDENGKEIKNYVVEREARFKGGLAGWKKFLEKNLNANVAADAKAPAGDHTVRVEFIVSKEGQVSKVKAVGIPEKCKPCAREAVSVIANGPDWEPAIQNNMPVNYRALQLITFQVEEEKKGKN